jgi:hypothetical protein
MMTTMTTRMIFLIKKITTINNLTDHLSTNNLLLSEDSPNNTTRMKIKKNKTKQKLNPMSERIVIAILKTKRKNKRRKIRKKLLNISLKTKNNLKLLKKHQNPNKLKNPGIPMMKTLHHPNKSELKSEI